jgi:hypothetical protein
MRLDVELTPAELLAAGQRYLPRATREAILQLAGPRALLRPGIEDRMAAREYHTRQARDIARTVERGELRVIAARLADG